jgi:mRNA-degrading endonuclease toxin of MazEF toxin-antitoxin module
VLDPLRRRWRGTRPWLVIGPDRAANLLEVIVLITAEGDELIIHAMPLRATYRKLLDP